MASPRTILRFPLLLLVLVVAGCGGDGADESAGADEVESAAMVDPATFDTLSWDSPAEALDRGDTVYQYSCAKCHGGSGTGKAGYVLNGRVLRPPSFKAEDWRFGQDLERLREYIYEGNDKGMPHWGAAGLSARDIDAVARYIQRRLWGRL
jgi:mono/diheme cytochrome c family protein